MEQIKECDKMTDDDNTFKERARKLWIFVMISGLLHLYIGYVFITTDILRFNLLSTLFIWAFVANGIGEMLFRFLVFRTPDTQRVFASSYDIVVGVLIYAFPIFSVMILPVYLAISLIIRGVTDIIVSRNTANASLTSGKFLRNTGWLKIAMALVILVFAVIAPSNVAVAGTSIVLAGMVNILLSLQFRAYRSITVISHS